MAKDVHADRESAGLFMLDQAMGYAYPAALRAAAAVGVADHLVDGPKTVDELGELTQTDGEKLRRVLRLLATRGVFREDEQGRFELTPAADLLRTGVPLSVRDGVLMITSKALWLSTGDLVQGLRTEGPAFEQMFGSKIWEYWGKDLPPEEDFHKGMYSMSEPEIQDPVRRYEWPEGATVVDVGGGYGSVLLLVLRENPSLRGILFDQEHVLANHRLGELGADDRWEVASGDFFEKVPQGDVHLLKYITHDWDDQRAGLILRNCREASQPGGRLVVLDTVIPSGNEPHFGKQMDMLVMSIYPGRERTEEDFRKLLADAGWRLDRVVHTDSYISVIEGVAV